MAEGAMTALLSSITEFGTAAIGWMGDIFAEVNSEPALLIMVIAIPIFGVAIGYLNRLFRLG